MDSSATNRGPSPRSLVEYEECEIVEDALYVRGTLPPGTAVRLDVRRYKSPPAYAAVEVLGVDAGESAGDGQLFALRLDLPGVWGRDGIEVVGPTGSVRFDRPSRS